MQKITAYFLPWAAALLLSMALTSPLMAAAQIMSASDAQAAVNAGEMLLLDIRSMEEWKEDGIAEGALPVSMYDNDFVERLNKIIGQRNGKKIGLICATGGRTAYVTAILDKNGLTGIVDVSEGMHGNQHGSGWIKRGMPVVDLDKARQRYAEITK